MTELLTRLSSFFNLQKTASVSVPGIMLAVALVFLYYVGPLRTFQTNDKAIFAANNLAIPEQCNALFDDQSAESGSTGRLTKRDWDWYQQRRRVTEDCLRQLQDAQISSQKEIALRQSRIAAGQKAADDFMAQYLDYSKKGNELAGRFKELADNALGAVNRDRQATKAEEAKSAAYSAIITSVQQDQKAAADRLRAGDQEQPFNDFVQKLIDKAVYVALLGLVLGLMLDPLTKQLQLLLYTDRVIKFLNKRTKRAPVPTKATRQKEFSVNYAVGMGLISPADVQTLEDRYAISGQFCLGMILPITVFIVAGGIYLSNHRPASEVPESNRAVTAPRAR